MGEWLSKKEEATDACNNLDGHQGHYDEQRRQPPKPRTVGFYLYHTLKMAKW